MSEPLNIDPNEQRKFAALANSWWDPDGDFRPLHDLNPIRFRFINERCTLEGAKVLDIGCGGGLLCESMAAAGATVTGIDVVEKSLKIARLHLHESGQQVDYQLITAEQLADQVPASYDVVTCLEMLEHVPQPDEIVKACARLVKPSGELFFSTINRTPQAFALAIVGAEHVLRLLPRGTHEYDKFIRPSELSGWCRQSGLEVVQISGLHYNPLNRSARLGAGVAVNYMMHASPGEETA